MRNIRKIAWWGVILGVVLGPLFGQGDTDMSIKGPAFFKDGENVLFLKPVRVVSDRLDGAALAVQCETRGYLKRTNQTHETRLPVFEEQKDIRGILYLEIRFWSPEVFRVRFSDRPLPEGEPAFPDEKGRMLVGRPDRKVEASLEESEEAVILRTSAVTLRLDKEPVRLSARDADGRLFWSERRADVFTADVFDIAVSRVGDRAAVFESFDLGGQDAVYGLGERFDGVERRGRAVDFWNKDVIGTSNTRSYINVPFLISTAGYGLFLNSSCRTEWEVGTRDGSTLGFSVEDAVLDYFVIHGPRPAEILSRYASLTGVSPTPPIWSFGLWMSRNSYESWDVVEGVAAGLRERGIPADVLHLDTDWFEEDWNCDLKFAADRFADPEEHLRKLRQDGFRVSLWQYNFVPAKANNDNYREGREKGYFALGPDGGLFAYPTGTKGDWIDDAIIDFSNPKAAEWYAAQIRNLIRMGAATIKTDFGEGIPEEAVFRNIEGRRVHNLYSLVYNSVVAEAVRDVTGEHIVWARSGTAGSQRYPVHWGGDSQCSWAGLAGTLKGGLSLGLSGFAFFSHDIGGFIGRPSPELYVRWAQLGLFSSHARCHGAGNDNSREPWTFGPEAERIFKKYDFLRYRLLPYIYSQARACSRTAKPMLRHLVIDYPDDPNVRHLEDEYLFGDSFLVAPVLAPLEETRERRIYLPAGVWVDYWTKQPVTSRGEWIDREVDLETLPLYVKAGSIIPYGEEKQSTGDEIGPIALLEVYRGAEGALDYNDGRTAFQAALTGAEFTWSGLSYKPEIKFY
jgi:alpha-D-xyloside xylohydrolase